MHVRKDDRKRRVRKIKTHRLRDQRKKNYQRLQARQEVNRRRRQLDALHRERQLLARQQAQQEEEDRRVEAMRQEQREYALANHGTLTAEIVDLMYERDPETGELPEALDITAGRKKFYAERTVKNIIKVLSVGSGKSITIPAPRGVSCQNSF